MVQRRGPTGTEASVASARHPVEFLARSRGGEPTLPRGAGDRPGLWELGSRARVGAHREDRLSKRTVRGAG